MSKKVLVIGGAGFLGSHVADQLSNDGFKVKIFDMARSPYLRNDQEMVIGNILDQEVLNKEIAGCDYVYHFAGLADINEARNEPIKTAQLNIMGTLNILEACVQNKVERFIFASSVYVYSIVGSFYRISKQACENFIEEYQLKYGLNYTILRFGSLYGRRADDKNAIYGFLKNALQNKKITYQGSPKAQREYIHVQDCAKLSAIILKDEYKNRNLILTGQEKLTIENLLGMIKEMLPQNVEIEFTKSAYPDHYILTPYHFQPKIGHKLVLNDYVDLGQGLLDCMTEITDGSHRV